MNTDREKIKRFASGKFSFNDYLTVSELFKTDKQELKKWLEEEWHETENNCSHNEQLAQLLDRMHHQINLKATKKPLLKLYHSFSKIAAILLLPALIIIAVLSYYSIEKPEGSETWAEIHSLMGTRTKFRLPDGTEGWLNSGSSIKYPVNFESRRVEISGEAWFDVAHNKSKEFLVITPSLDIKVVGTRFNVIAYNDETTAEVILEKGKVVVLNKENNTINELEPDQHFILDKKTKIVTQTHINAELYSSWKDGLLILKNETMSEIAKRLERRYNVEIILHGDSLKSSVFRATFLDENLEEICKLLSTVAPVKYKIHKREKQPDNTFSKTKIEIWMKDET